MYSGSIKNARMSFRNITTCQSNPLSQYIIKNSSSFNSLVNILEINVGLFNGNTNKMFVKNKQKNPEQNKTTPHKRKRKRKKQIWHHNNTTIFEHV